MDNSQGSVPQAMSFCQVFLYRSPYVLGGKAMQIKHIRDRQLYRNGVEWFAKGLVSHADGRGCSRLNGTPYAPSPERGWPLRFLPLGLLQIECQLLESGQSAS
jgi:hypothetical protein